MAEAVEQIGAPSERWLVEQLRAGRFPGRKIGRAWRMTAQDIADSLEVCRNAHRPVPAAAESAVGLTARSRLHLQGHSTPDGRRTRR
ncbi:hypothetical protein AU195_05685 [Mycobacterium sp. IS-1496]|nr:hypothetical protein AU195_05685 [Mycobacterium sp. IS-1496]